MKPEKDYEEFIRLLNKNKVKYCVVGAYAIAFYGEQKIYFAGLKELIKNKKASKRKQDKVDLGILSKIKNNKPR